MRKFLLTIILLFTITLITSCNDIPTEDKPIVVTSVFPAYDIVRWIAQDKVNLYLTVSPGVDTHSYDPSVNDIISIKKSDLFIYTSDALEQWAKGLKEEGITLNLSDNDKIILEEVEEKHEHHTQHTHDHDPHIWTSPTYVKYMVEDIYQKLVLIDPSNQSFFEKNKTRYIIELDIIIEKMKQLSIDAEGVTYYFGTPFAMYYLFHEFDIHYESIYETCATEIEPSIEDIINTHKEIKENNVKNVYVKELMSTSVAERLIKDTNAELTLLHSGHNVSKDDFEKGITLIQIMNNNIDALRKELANEIN